MTDADANNANDPLVTQIMRTDCPVVQAEDTVARAASILASYGLPGVPVIENGKMIGIIGETDIIAREADVDVPLPVPFLDAIFMADAGPQFDEEMRKVLAVTARDLMSSPVVSVRSTATLTEVATIMADRQINPLPVLDDDLNLIGIVSRSDLVRVIAALEQVDGAEDE